MTKQEYEICAFYVVMSIVMSGIILLIALCTNGYAEPIVDLSIIAKIESSNNPFAWNKADDSRGLYQITPICLKEFNNYHSKKYAARDLWNVKVNREIADWYFNQRIPQMLRYYKVEDTLENRIIAYNAGIAYLVNKNPIPRITRLYIAKYRRFSHDK